MDAAKKPEFKLRRHASSAAAASSPAASFSPTVSSEATVMSKLEAGGSPFIAAKRLDPALSIGGAGSQVFSLEPPPATTSIPTRRRLWLPIAGLFGLILLTVGLGMVAREVLRLVMLEEGTTSTTNSRSSPSSHLHEEDLHIRLVGVSREEGEGFIRVRFENTATFATHEFAMVRDEHMFASPEDFDPVQTYQSLHPTRHEWGAARLVSENGIEGHFSAPALGGHFQILPKSSTSHLIRRVLDTSHTFTDAVVESEAKKKLKLAHRGVEEESPEPLGSLGADEVISFTPNCFPADEHAHTLPVSFAIDQALMNKLGATTRADVQAYIESFFGIVRVIYLTQLNVQLQVGHILLPDGSQDVLGNGGCGRDPLQTLYKFNAFVKSNARVLQDTPTWHLLTDCHPPPGTVGASFIGGLCSGTQQTSVTSHGGDSTYLTFAHELGHMFSASHVFELNGQGGIMDYGAGSLHGGPVQFSPSNRADMCEMLTAVKQYCAHHFQPTTKEEQCGNGLLEPGEECECLKRGDTRCGACKQCSFKGSSPECSTEEFVMRSSAALAGDVLVVSEELLSHTECCTENGKLHPPPAGCLGGEGVCSPQGQCEKACAAFFLPGCGFEDNGCVQRCVYRDKCWGAELATSGPPPIPVGAVPNGLACPGGTCASGKCVASSSSEQGGTKPDDDDDDDDPEDDKETVAPSTSYPTPLPTRMPTSFPIRIQQQQEDGGKEVVENECPAEHLFTTCPRQSKEENCAVQGCVWCAGRCRVGQKACDNLQAWLSETYAGCPPFTKSG